MPFLEFSFIYVDLSFYLISYSLFLKNFLLFIYLFIFIFFFFSVLIVQVCWQWTLSAFVCLKKSLFCLHFWQNFSEWRSLDQQFFSNALEMSFHWFLSCIVFDQKIYYKFSLCLSNVSFTLECLQEFIFAFQQLDYNFFWCLLFLSLFISLSFSLLIEVIEFVLFEVFYYPLTII